MKAKREVELEWSEAMKERFAKGADEKQLMAYKKERKRLDMMEGLKSLGGPFTNSAEVKEYLEREDPELDARTKQQRLKREVQFARESSTTLPRCDPVFKIQITLPNKKRRDKTANEFAESLTAYLGNKEARCDVEYDEFKKSVDKLTMLTV